MNSPSSAGKTRDSTFRNRKFVDSSLEGDGFELSVREHRAMAPSHGFAAASHREAALRGAPASHSETAFRAAAGFREARHRRASRPRSGREARRRADSAPRREAATVAVRAVKRLGDRVRCALTEGQALGQRLRSGTCGGSSASPRRAEDPAFPPINSSPICRRKRRKAR